MTSTSGSRERSVTDDSKIELGPMGSSRPGDASDSANARLLDDEGGSARPSVLHNVREAAAKSTAMAAVLSYCAASISMTVINKFAVSGEKFTMNLLVLLCQCVVGVAMVWTAKLLGWVQLRELNMHDVKTWFPISTMLVFVIYTGSKALAYGEVIWFDGRITPLVFSSFVLMVLSSVIAASPDLMPSLTASSLARRANDLAMYTGVPMGPTSGAAAVTPMAAAAPAPVATAGLSHNGYVWMLANCLVSATYVLVMRKRIKLTGFKDWDTMFFNNLLSIPVLLVMSLLVENWSAETFERNFPAERRSTLMFAIILSGTGGVFISYTTAWCIRVTSSTTYSMVGALNKLPLALSGILFFGNALTLYNSCGIAVGFIAGILYAVGKNKQAEAARLANSAATGASVPSSRMTAGGGHVSDPQGEIPTHHRERRD